MTQLMDDILHAEPIRVMLVEDEHIVALELQHLLARLGHHLVASYSSGEEAIANVVKINPDIILMDIRLQGKLDGIMTAEAINSKGDYPLVYITAYSDAKTLNRAKNTEPYGYILKPINIRELDAVLQISLYKNQMEQQIRNRERKYFHLFERSNDSIVIFEKRTGLIREANSSAVQMAGLNDVELIGMRVHDFISQENIHIFAAMLRSSRARQGHRLEGRVVSASGNVIEVDASLSEIDAENGLMQAILRDVSERNRMQRALKENEKLTAQNEMAARIAHEINNPLGGIKNSFLLIRDAIPDDHKYYPYVGRIEQEIERIARIVKQMLNMYRPVRQNLADVDLRTSIQDVVAMMALKLDARAVHIQYDAPSAPVILRCSRDDIMQILYNVLQNAADATPDNGTIVLNLLSGSHSIQIDVSDEGTGIPEDVQPHIFDPFYTTKEEISHSGLGLGLSVTKSLIESSGGTISFSTGADGTTFHLRFMTSEG